MRKTAFMLSLGAVCVAVLSGCKSKSKYKVPTTPYDKVATAFNGVEKSYSNYKSSEKTNSGSKTRASKRIGQTDSSGALTDIATLYTSYDSQGDKIDELEYDQPPMIQFQCLKKVFELVGKDFSFGTKYTDTISGEVYFDPTTGDKKEQSPEYKYNYNFTLSIGIDIDSSDLINADVSFKIDLTQGETVLETNWYVQMILDYEMEKESPTYTLSMYSENEEDDLSYFEYGNTYEYDYVDMKDGRINEWRKFCYEVNKPMVKNETHTNYADYIGEADFKAQIGASKWYKNADLRKISHPNTSKTNKFIAALFDKLGLNSTDINASTFVNKNGVKNNAIVNAYNAFSNIFKQDLIYALITGSEGHEQQKVKSELRVMDFAVTNEINHIMINEDITLRNLFNGEEGNYGIWYFDQNGEALEQVEDLNTVRFRFSIPYGSSNEEKVFDNSNLDDRVIELYESLGKENYNLRHTNAILRISDDLTLLNAFVQINIGNELHQRISLYFRGFFPDELINLGFPVYEGENCLFDYRDDIQMVLDISQTNATELKDFKNSLVNAHWSEEETETQIKYNKLDNNRLLSIDIEDNNISDGIVRIFYNIKNITKNEWPKEDIIEASNGVFDLEAPQSQNGYFVTDLDGDIVTLKNFSESEQLAFIEELKNAGDSAETVSNDGGIYGINVKAGTKIYYFGLMVGPKEIQFNYSVLPETTYHVSNILLEKEGEAESTLIPLKEDLSGYLLESILPYEAGVYKIKKVDLDTLEETYITMECEGSNLSFDTGELELTLLYNTVLTFSADLSITSVLVRQN